MKRRLVVTVLSNDEPIAKVFYATSGQTLTSYLIAKEYKEMFESFTGLPELRVVDYVTEHGGGLFVEDTDYIYGKYKRKVERNGSVPFGIVFLDPNNFEYVDNLAEASIDLDIERETIYINAFKFYHRRKKNKPEYPVFITSDPFNISFDKIDAACDALMHVDWSNHDNIVLYNHSFYEVVM